MLAAFPVAGLAAVVVYAATRLVDVRELVRFGRFRTSELVLAIATTVSVLVLDVLLGIVAAIALSVLDLLRRVARPHDAVLGIVPGLAGMHDVDDYPSAQVVPGLMIYRYDSPLFFANAEDFRTRALASVDEAETPVRWFVLNAEAVSEVDITAADALEELRKELDRRGVVVGIARMKEELREDLRRTAFLRHVPVDRHLRDAADHGRGVPGMGEAAADHRMRLDVPGTARVDANLAEGAEDARQVGPEARRPRPLADDQG